VIDAICWDVGGVFSARPIDAVGRAAADHDLDPDELFSAIFGPYQLDGDHPWHRLERGEIALTEAWSAIEAAMGSLGVELSLVDFFRRFGDDPVDRSIVVDTVRELHDRGLVMAIITNNVREFSGSGGGGWRSLVPMELMSAVVDSCEVGVRKPDPAIYLHTLEVLGVAADTVVFVDDMVHNVDAARGLGLHGVVVDADPSNAMAELVTLVDRLS
jgi:putative hydrolase of the HAD superfamily